MNEQPSWWDAQITIFRKAIDEVTEETTYTVSVAADCFWKNKFEEVRAQDGSTKIISAIVRIPASSIGAATLSVDDVLILGDVSASVPADGALSASDVDYLIRNLKASNRPVGRVYSVTDNARYGFGVPHLKVMCQQ